LASSQGNVQIQTPSVDVEPSEAGSYLVSVTGDGNSEITAREGSIAVVTPQGTQDVDPGKTMLVTGQAANPQYQYVDEVAVSDLESWGDQRDQSMVVADDAQAQDVPSGMTGTSDLNQYGNWVDIPGYGQAWVPSDQAPGWTPYSSGQWVTLNYYGPTFVAAVPWGWAPYHYGSWFFTAGVGWAWTPGPRYVRPVWAPRVRSVLFIPHTQCSASTPRRVNSRHNSACTLRSASTLRSNVAIMRRSAATMLRSAAITRRSEAIMRRSARTCSVTLRHVAAVINSSLGVERLHA